MILEWIDEQIHWLYVETYKLEEMGKLLTGVYDMSGERYMERCFSGQRGTLLHGKTDRKMGTWIIGWSMERCIGTLLDGWVGGWVSTRLEGWIDG